MARFNPNQKSALERLQQSKQSKGNFEVIKDAKERWNEIYGGIIYDEATTIPGKVFKLERNGTDDWDYWFDTTKPAEPEDTRTETEKWLDDWKSKNGG